MPRPKVFKVNKFYWNGYALDLGLVDQDDNSHPYGNVVLSLPFKKGRRKLVKGIVRAEPYSSRYMDGLRYELLFTPSSQVQLDKVMLIVNSDSYRRF